MKLGRKQFLLAMGASFALTGLPVLGQAAEPIVIGVPAAQSGPVGVADQKDWVNGISPATVRNQTSAIYQKLKIGPCW
jgi:branched-chain amino acid transport system substrate-binding protein